MTSNIRTLFILISFLSFQSTFGQLKLGTYKIIPDTTSFLEEYSFSELTFNQNKTFNYKYRTSMGCLLWYDSKGKWTIRKDSLVLTDTVMSYHSVIDFTKNKATNKNKISILVNTKNKKPIPGIKILCIFKNAKDTIMGLTNAEGKFILNTKQRTATKKEDKYSSIDDAEIWVVYFSKKQKEQTTNYFSSLSAEIECVIDDDAKNEAVLRTTIYRIVKTNLLFSSQWYNKEDARPGQYLFGDFVFDKE